MEDGGEDKVVLNPGWTGGITSDPQDHWVDGNRPSCYCSFFRGRGWVTLRKSPVDPQVAKPTGRGCGEGRRMELVGRSGSESSRVQRDPRATVSGV